MEPKKDFSLVNCVASSLLAYFFTVPLHEFFHLATSYAYGDKCSVFSAGAVEPMHLIEERAVKQRIFFPKNNAMTNVELHTWHNVENPFADEVYDEEKKRILLYAFEPDWDNRYGFYWENGWFYVYRSGVLLLRFQLKPMPDGTYRICHLQKTEAPQAMVGALSEALFSLKWK